MRSVLALIALLSIGPACVLGDIEEQISEWAGDGPVYTSPVYRVTVYDDGGAVPTPDEVDAEIGRVLMMYEERVPHERWSIRYLPGMRLHAVPGPFDVRGRLVVGYYLPGAGVTVALDGRPLHETALAHEIGHVLTQCCSSSAETSREYGVP